MTSRFIAVRVEKVSSIFEGRIFLLDRQEHWEEGDLKPDPDEEKHITLEGEPCPVEIAGPDMPVACPECGELLESQILAHTYSWMNMVFTCRAHPKRMWLDSFPKTRFGDTGWDKTNAWPEFIVPGIPIDRDLLAVEGMIVGATSHRDTYNKERKIAPIKFVLTRDGLKKVGVIEALKQKVQELRTRFVPLQK